MVLVCCRDACVSWGSRSCAGQGRPGCCSSPSWQAGPEPRKKRHHRAGSGVGVLVTGCKGVMLLDRVWD